MDYRIAASVLSRVNTHNYDKDFEFEFEGSKFTCPSILAEVVSSKVSELRKLDATVCKIHIPIVLKNRDETVFKLKAIMRGENVSLKQNEETVEVMLYLGNTDISGLFFREATIDNVLSQIQMKEKFQCDTSKEICFSAQNFEKIKNIPFSKEQWISILSSPELKLKNETSLLLFVQEKIHEDRNNSALLRFIKNEFLDKEGIEIYVNLIDSFDNDTIGSLWPLLRQRFSSSSRIQCIGNRFEKDEFQYPFSPQTPFQGIFHKLSEKCQGNIIDKGVITATSSSLHYSNYSLNHVVQNDGEFGTSCETNKNPWVIFDFQDRLIAVSHYSIKTNSSVWDKDAFPKTWKLEGSNNSQNWDILDERNNCESIHGHLKEDTFSTTKIAFYKYIRMTHIGPNWSNSYFYLAFSQIEFFGNLQLII